jgi:hypothetical protein
VGARNPGFGRCDSHGFRGDNRSRAKGAPALPGPEAQPERRSAPIPRNIGQRMTPSELHSSWSCSLAPRSGPRKDTEQPLPDRDLDLDRALDL